MENKKHIRLFDAHCDTASRIYYGNSGLYRSPGHTDLSRGGAFGGYAQMYAVFTTAEDRYGEYRRILQYLRAELAKNEAYVSFCTNRAEAEQAIGEGKTAAFFSVEGGELLRCGIAELEEAAAEGVAAVNLTWNFENLLSGSNAEGKGRGLTERGAAFVRRAQELDVLVDVSHLSDPGFWDVMAVAEKPVIASHSNSRALCGHSRNLTDPMFRALAEHGGVAGLNLYSEFVGGRNDVEAACAHILHFLDLGGEKNVGIGADFDGCDRLPEGITGLESMDRLYEALLKNRVPQSTADDIFFYNFMRVLR